MSIYKRKSGRWAVRVDVDRAAMGVRRRRSLGTFATKKAAESAERKALEARENGHDLAPQHTTLAQVVEHFFADVRPRWSSKTYERAEGLWRNNLSARLGAIPLSKLRPAHLAQAYTELRVHGRVKGKGGLSERSIHHAHRFLHRVLGGAERMELAGRNVARSVDPPKPGPSASLALDPDEAIRLLEAADGTRWQPFLVLALCAGARRGELCALTWNDLDLDGGLVTISKSLGQTKDGLYVKPTKSGRSRVVRLSALAVETLRAHRDRQLREFLAVLDGDELEARRQQREEYVFTDAHGALVKPFNYSDAFARLARKAKLRTTRLHSTGHSAATWMIAGGTDVRTVGEVLGHSSAAVTLSVYAHAMPGRQEGAVALIDHELDRARQRKAASSAK